MLARTGLLRLERMLVREGDQFRLFMVLYLSFRLLIESIKPMPFAYLGLISGIQVLCILGLLYYGRDLLRWVKGNP